MESIKLNAGSEIACKNRATEISFDNPGKYVTVHVLFGEATATIHDRLNVYAPSDSTFGWYALNSRIKMFTESQIIADQNATPTMS